MNVNWGWKPGFLALVLAGSGVAAAAQDLPFDPSVLDGCDEGRACIGRGAEACIAAGDDRFETHAGCYWAEAAYWKATAVEAMARLADEFPDSADDIEVLGLTWDDHVRAMCGFVSRFEFGDGAQARIALARCTLRLRGDHALFFIEMQER